MKLTSATCIAAICVPVLIAACSVSETPLGTGVPSNPDGADAGPDATTKAPTPPAPFPDGAADPPDGDSPAPDASTADADAGPLVCNAGFADCDKIAANGCETNLGNDPLHCGACSHACVAGGSCASATCTPQVLAWDLYDDSGRMRVFGDSLFLGTNGGLMRVKKDGSSSQVWINNFSRDSFFEVVGDRVYASGCYASLAAQGPSTCFDNDSVSDTPVATDGTDVYYFHGYPRSALYAVPVAGGATRVVTSTTVQQPLFLAIVGGRAYYQDYYANTWSIGTDGTGLAALPQVTVGLRKVSSTLLFGTKTGAMIAFDTVAGTESTFLQDPKIDRYTIFTVTDTDVFYSGNGVGIRRAPRSGAAATTLSKEDALARLVDGGWLYFAAWGPDKNGKQGSLVRIPLP